MLKTEYRVIGVMSGTSLDGVDMAYVTFNFDTKWSFKIHHAQTVSYSKYWIGILERLIDFSFIELKQIDLDYTTYLASLINAFIKKFSIENIDAVCSHGHTALHRPEKRLTYQIGNLPKIAELVNQIVVCDFRTQDVELGGQGAPLVPMGDELLFPRYEFCINLGGFANVSTKLNKVTIAYDICPVNTVINHYAKQSGFDFDDKGKIASSGKIDNRLLDRLNELDYYNQKFPKSLGIEWVYAKMLPLVNSTKLCTENVLRTLIEHIAIQITKEINVKKNAKTLITGGGVYNLFLIKQLRRLTNNEIIIPTKQLIEYKEALIFGFLGILKLRGEINCFRSVTGAKRDHSSGKIFHP